MSTTPKISAPSAAHRPSSRVQHGVTLEDPYAWLKDENWQQVMRDPATLDAEIRAHLEAENAWLDATLEPVKALRKTLVAEMRGRIKEDDSSVPAKDGDYAYFAQYLEGGEHPRFCRRAADTAFDSDAKDEVLYDADEDSKAHSYFRVGDCQHSPDHALVGISADVSGAEYFDVRFRRISSGEWLDDVIPKTAGGFTWAADSTTVFYTVLDDNHRPYAVMRHAVGTPVSDDVQVYEETDPGFFVGTGTTDDERYIVIDAHDHETSEVHLIDAREPTGTPRVVAPRTPGIEYSVDHLDGELLILTNADDSVDFKLVAASVATPGRDHWRDLVPHRPGTLITGFSTFSGHTVRLERENALPRLVVRDNASGEEHSIEFDEAAYGLGLGGGYEFDTTSLRFSYSSPTTPSQVFDYDMGTRERSLRKTQEVPSGHDAGDYVTERLHATASDGAKVPVTVLYRKDTPLDGSAPLLLYGYGSYGHSTPASFSTGRLSLVDRGFVYAIAHVRGGTECGYGWYLDGKREHKTNTFTDFTAAGDHLVANGYSSAGKLACHGGSAGGMLVGAVANMRPDLWGAVVGEVPFVDVLNTMSDASLPLTPPEWPEWGNPIESKEDFDRILAYSPYDNVEAKPYPHVLATGGLTDPRVTYWEPAKWAARLRATRTDRGMTLLYTNMDAGHGGAAGRFQSLEETALVFAFVLLALGKAQEA